MGTRWIDPLCDGVYPAGRRLAPILQLIEDVEGCRQPAALLKIARMALPFARTAVHRAGADDGDLDQYCPIQAALRWARLVHEAVKRLRHELRRDAWALALRTGRRCQPTAAEAAADRAQGIAQQVWCEVDALDKARFFGQPAGEDHADAAAAALDELEGVLADIRRLLGPRGEFPSGPVQEPAT